MPFTFSHPALVLPLNWLPKKWFSLTGLIIGSIMPDLEAFLRFTSEKDQSHTWEALLWFCLPLGLLISFLYHHWIRNPFIYHLPSFLQKRFSRYTSFNWWQHVKKNVPVVLLSFLLGGASHLIWDSFTHYDGVLLKLNPGWDRNTTVFGYSIEVVYLIQHINTLIGLVVISIAILQLPMQHKQNINYKWLPYWFSIVVIAGVIFTIRFLMLDNLKIDDIIVSCLTAIILGVFITTFFYRKKYKTPALQVEKTDKY